MMYERPTLLGDRLVPSRRTTDFEAAHHMMMSGGQAGRNVLSYGMTAPVVPALCKQRIARIRGIRGQDVVPGMIQNDLRDDYYLNLVDWSSKNVMAIALGARLYWTGDFSSNLIHLAMECDEPHYICSVKFCENGSLLAAGLSSGNVVIMAFEGERAMRTVAGSRAPVSSLAWNGQILSTGSSTGQIFHYHLGIVESHMATFKIGRNLDVCSLQWSGDRRYLASGTSDSLVYIWQGFDGQTIRTTPLRILDQHRGAVKGVSWCPWKHNVLATGGDDGTLKVWNVNTGECVNTLDTNSGVSGIVWNTEHSEMLTSHDNHTLQLRKYPTMHKLGELKKHAGRILNLAVSPDGKSVLSVGADQRMVKWDCFPSRHKDVRPRSCLDLCSFR